MGIPAAVDSLLRKQNIEYVVEDGSGDKPDNAVQTALLQDGTHRLHILFPAGTLLDLNAVGQMTGWQMRAMSPSDVHKLCQLHHMESVPAVPATLGLPTLVDRKILDAPEIVLNSGPDGKAVAA